MNEDLRDLEYRNIPPACLDRWPDIKDWAYLNNAYELASASIMFKPFAGDVSSFFHASNILIIGCGSPESSLYDDDKGREFEAWMPRLAWGFGARNIVGIDIRSQDPNDSDIYTHVAANFVPYIQNGNFQALLSQFDIRFNRVISHRVFEGQSPTLLRTIGMHDDHYVAAEANRIINDLQTRLIEQLPSVMSDSGLITIDYDIVAVDHGMIIPLRK